MSGRSISRCLVILTLLVIATVNCSANVYDAASSFESGWLAQTNPNGVWSYGYSAGFTSSISLYTTTQQNGINGPNAQYWLTPSVDIGASPAAEYNNGAAYSDGNINFLANEFLLVAGVGGRYFKPHLYRSFHRCLFFDQQFSRRSKRYRHCGRGCG